MLFNSLEFLVFFPIVCLIYFFLPHKCRHIWLLVSSYFFYMNWNAKYVLLLLLSTVGTYISGLLIQKANDSGKGEIFIKYRKNFYIAISFVSNISILFFFKYFTWLADFVNSVFAARNLGMALPRFNVILPVGISFYILQSLSYTMDVYRGEISAQKNFTKYALFVSFFPQLVAGPIERSKNLLYQIDEKHCFDYNRMVRGMLLMLWGYFLKLVIADRIALYVDTVFGNYSVYNGMYLIVGAALFAIQVYCDFAGYSNIAIGTSEIMGFKLMENFDCPYFSRSVSEFWRRWHISLSSWFKDYLYIPLGGNRKGKLRKHINILVVFCVSGLWHGANWTYLVWGGVNGLFQVIGELLLPVKAKAAKLLKVKEYSIGHRLLQTIFTFILVDSALVFFRAERIKSALEIFRSMLSEPNIFILTDGSLYRAGLNQKNFTVLWISLLILFFADYLKYKGYIVRDIIMKQDLWFRWFIYIMAIMGILIYGIWGGNYDAASFIYFQF